jgi:hypothetical protein
MRENDVATGVQEANNHRAFRPGDRMSCSRAASSLKLRKALPVLIIASLVAGCGLDAPERTPPRTLTPEQVDQLRNEVQALGDKCKSLRLSGRVPGFVGSVHCSNPGILAAYQKVDFPYMSVLNLALAQRLQLAERADAKKISEGDMLVEFFSDTRGLPAMCTP